MESTQKALLEMAIAHAGKSEMKNMNNKSKSTTKRKKKRRKKKIMINLMLYNKLINYIKVNTKVSTRMNSIVYLKNKDLRASTLIKIMTTMKMIMKILKRRQSIIHNLHKSKQQLTRQLKIHWI
jgi:hypothetical protein